MDRHQHGSDRLRPDVATFSDAIVVTAGRTEEPRDEVPAAVTVLTRRDIERLPPGWLGKNWAMDQASRIARGELLLFADADVRYAPDTLRAAVAHIEREPDIAMVALLPYFEMHGFWENIAMPALTMFGFTILPANRTRAVALAVGAGTGNLVRREASESKYSSPD